jgi:hypothetical protein
MDKENSNVWKLLYLRGFLRHSEIMQKTKARRKENAEGIFMVSTDCFLPETFLGNKKQVRLQS